jgi:prepilin-type N-terminal cleavage/methylation domain-containing protein
MKNKGFTPSLENDIVRKHGQSPMSFFSAGFTLIELLIVIAIIGILSSIVLSTLNTSRAKAVNSKIQQQLANFRSGAEVYFNVQNPVSYGPTTVLCDNMFAETSATQGQPGAYISVANLPPGTSRVCGATTDAYAVMISNAAGDGYWCADSKGALKQKIGAMPASSTVCPP